MHEKNPADCCRYLFSRARVRSLFPSTTGEQVVRAEFVTRRSLSLESDGFTLLDRGLANTRLAFSFPRTASGLRAERPVFADEGLAQGDQKSLVPGGGRRKAANHRPVIVDALAGRHASVVTQGQWAPESWLVARSEAGGVMTTTAKSAPTTFIRKCSKEQAVDCVAVSALAFYWCARD